MVFGDFLTRVRERAPLVHNITNYVTVNDVANMILACGASPIMSDAVSYTHLTLPTILLV